MFNKIEDLTRKAELASAGRPTDPTLMQTVATLYLAKEVSELKATLERVTEASSFLPGGFAIRTVAVK